MIRVLSEFSEFSLVEQFGDERFEGSLGGCQLRVDLGT